VAANCLNQASLSAPNGVAIPTVQTARQWTPRFAINYKPDDDLLVFVSAARGYRSGGWNARGYDAFELLPFGPESVWSYETGIKSEWFGRRLRANITGFWQDSRNFQTPSAFVRADNSVAFVTGNSAGYRNRGVEIELAAVPIPDLNLFANLGFQDDEYRIDRRAPDFDRFGNASIAMQQAQCAAQLAARQVPLSANTSPPGAAPGNAPACANGIITSAGGIARPVRTPRFSAAVGASYDWRLPAPGIILTPTANIIYRSGHETGTANATIFTGAITAGAGGGGQAFPANPFAGDVITGSRADNYVLVNAGVAMRTDEGNWTLALECFNCFDSAFVDSSFANTSYLNPPRTWQVRLKRVL
jgi:iron complex outermembrane receptor protein